MSKRESRLTNKEGDVRELKNDDISVMRSAAEVLPKELFKALPKRKIGQRGHQKKPIKKAITIRYSPEVIEYFKSTGEGWQTRMDEVLRAWVKKHPKAA